MKIHIEPTSRIIEVTGPDGTVPARVWQGVTDNGIEIACCITRIAAHVDSDRSELEAALVEVAPPTGAAVEAWPNRLIL